MNVQSFAGQAVEVEAVKVESVDDLLAIRASEWSDGQVRLMSYPTAAPVAYVGVTPPLSMFGRVLAIGNWLVKGPAGDLVPMSDSQFTADFARLA